MKLQRKRETRHLVEIEKNLEKWKSKPVLQKIYTHFYQLIARCLNRHLRGEVVELGSGIGNFKTIVPDCICTDIFDNPWIDRVENAYCLSFPDSSVSHLVLFDVFHHIEYPGSAFKEFRRVLVPKGRVILFEPAMSMLGLIVYGLFHQEPVGYGRKIKWFAPGDFNCDDAPYFAAQSIAGRVFFSGKYGERLSGWNVLEKKKIAAISYVASGGYSKPQLFPDSFLPFFMKVDKLCGFLPFLFATRLLVVLEKKECSGE
jgi:SAM-dependent methyltransferase